jgi:ABC-type Fe3+/spermidine/putrescine transport system ATPase subunit
MSLRLRDVTKTFEVRGRPPVTAVDGVSLDVEHGTFCTLLGPSGCGKTTLLRMVAGFETPTRGTIAFDGRTLDGVPPYRRNFPMVFQSYALFPHMTVSANVAYGLRLRRLGRRDVAARVTAMLALLGLDAERDRHPAQLSGGQQQRVALARALVLDPRLILLDEPLSNLDTGLRVSMRDEIRALQRRLGITALYVTHDQEEALAVSDRVVVMNRGRVEQDGAPADVFHRPASEFVARFMGCPNIVELARADSGGCTLLGARYDFALPAGVRAARAALRPDAIVLDAPGARHAAVVESVTFLGARARLLLVLGDGTRLVADGPARPDTPLPTAGETLRFDVDAARLHPLEVPDPAHD